MVGRMEMDGAWEGAACGKQRQRVARFWLPHRARKQRSALRKLEAGSVPKVQGTVPRVSKTLGVPCPQGTIAELADERAFVVLLRSSFHSLHTPTHTPCRRAQARWHAGRR